MQLVFFIFDAVLCIVNPHQIFSGEINEISSRHKKSICPLEPNICCCVGSFLQDSGFGFKEAVEIGNLIMCAEYLVLLT